MSRVSVLLPEDDARRFEAFCIEKGYKKSTLIARLIRDLLDREQFPFQRQLFEEPEKRRTKNRP